MQHSPSSSDCQPYAVARALTMGWAAEQGLTPAEVQVLGFVAQRGTIAHRPRFCFVWKALGGVSAFYEVDLKPVCKKCYDRFVPVLGL